MSTAGLRAAVASQYDARAAGTRDPVLARHWRTVAARWRSGRTMTVFLWHLPEPWRPPGCHDDGTVYAVEADGSVAPYSGPGAMARWEADNAGPDPRLTVG